MKWGDIMVTVCQPLIEILSKIPDFRKEKGKRHPLSAILALACVVMMLKATVLSLNGVVTMTKNSQKLLVLPMKKLLALQPFGWCIGITSLSPEEASPKRLLDLVRSHWHIENKVHWVRDVTFDEDRSQVRCGNTPQVMALLRNTVIGLMRHCGIMNIASACRRFSARLSLHWN